MPARRVSDEEQLSNHLHLHKATSGTEMLPPQQHRRVTFEPEFDSTQVGTNTKNEGERDDSKMPAANTSSSDMDTGAYHNEQSWSYHAREGRSRLFSHVVQILESEPYTCPFTHYTHVQPDATDYYY